MVGAASRPVGGLYREGEEEGQKIVGERYVGDKLSIADNGLLEAGTGTSQPFQLQENIGAQSANYLAWVQYLGNYA